MGGGVTPLAQAGNSLHVNKSYAAEHIDELAETGLALLKSAANHVEIGGQIVYATCTVTYAENNGVVKAFLESEEGSSFKLAPINGKAAFVSQITTDSPDAHFAVKFVQKSYVKFRNIR